MIDKGNQSPPIYSRWENTNPIDVGQFPPYRESLIVLITHLSFINILIHRGVRLWQDWNNFNLRGGGTGSRIVCGSKWLSPYMEMKKNITLWVNRKLPNNSWSRIWKKKYYKLFNILTNMLLGGLAYFVHVAVVRRWGDEWTQSVDAPWLTSCENISQFHVVVGGHYKRLGTD